MSKIRLFEAKDWDAVWQMIEPVFRAGETYPYPSDITEKEAYQAWIEAPTATCVAVDENDSLVGTYYIKPNQPGRGSHVCNCGYIVAQKDRQKGIASQMCEDSQIRAVDLGFRAMQYNLVVSTNENAVYLWKKQGFTVIGTLPGAFLHSTHGYVDALLMYKVLKS